MATVVDVIVPLAVQELYSYSMPGDSPVEPQCGMRVLVPLGRKKIYTGVIAGVRQQDTTADGFLLKEVTGFPENEALVTGEQLKLWQWMAEYYMCTQGEVMKAALPAPLKPESETRVLLNTEYEAHGRLPERLIRVLDCLTDGKPKTIGELTRIISVKTLLPTINTLLEEGAITVEEVVENKTASQKAKAAVAPCNGGPLHTLTAAQQTALDDIHRSFCQNNVTLLFGVTSSGKTDIYTHLISEQLGQGRQVLYLVPEIALTTQLTERLRAVFGDKLCVYHSRLTENERTAIYRRIRHAGQPVLILGVRSALFLPFRSLGLVIVDEEHETSYKQQDPAPRYHARDTAIVLASFFGAKTLLGTATPAVETYNNALNGKYGLVRITERYKGLSLPAIRIIDLKAQYRRKEMYGHFSDPLFLRMREEIQAGKQVILFQNRRGYAPYAECRQCAYVPKCVNCDVSMTVHRPAKTADGRGTLVCHYCGYTIPVPEVCPACKTQGSLADVGFGTEKVEDELHNLLPDARVGRMDLDSTRNKNSHKRLISDFGSHNLDILVGTQMVTKGLHFDDVSLVGVLRADSMLNQPDFRATERTYHMLEQVAGRAGRTPRSGGSDNGAEVYIQTSESGHPVFAWLQQHDYEALYEAQIQERRLFRYPPFYRLITVIIRHRETSRLDTAARVLQERLRAVFGMRCSNVVIPQVSRVQNMHQRTLLLKIEREAGVRKAKEMLAAEIRSMQQLPQCKGVAVHCDVDPV